jgi:hypothetical protein
MSFDPVRGLDQGGAMDTARRARRPKTCHLRLRLQSLESRQGRAGASPHQPPLTRSSTVDATAQVAAPGTEV